MKLKTSSAAAGAIAHAATPSSGAPFGNIVQNNERSFASPPRTSTSDPFESFVRKMVARSLFAETPSESPSNIVNGTVVAQTNIDGVRYLMVRCQPKPAEALLSLSPRERDIVNLITKGYPNKTIADLLDISAWTVGTHLRRVFAKLGVTSRAAMVARYLHHIGD